MTEQKQEYSNKIISLETLPVIKYNSLEAQGELFDKRIKAMDIDNQVATPETLKFLKEKRAELNNDFKRFESARMEIKSAIMKPYNDFLELYNKCIKDKHEAAVPKFNTKIATVEDDLKSMKEAQLREYFNEYCTSVSVNFITFENVGLNITRSASDNKLKKQISEYVDGIAKDIELIKQLGEDQDYTNEVMADFYLTLNAAQSIANINTARARKKEIAEQRAKDEERKAQQAAQAPKVEPKAEPLQAPVAEKIPTSATQGATEDLIARFEVTAPREKLIALKAFLEDNNITFKTI